MNQHDRSQWILCSLCQFLREGNQSAWQGANLPSGSSAATAGCLMQPQVLLSLHTSVNSFRASFIRDWKMSVRNRQGDNNMGIMLKIWIETRSSNPTDRARRVRCCPGGFDIRECAMQTIAWNKKLWERKHGQKKLIVTRKQIWENKRQGPRTRTVEARYHQWLAMKLRKQHEKRV